MAEPRPGAVSVRSRDGLRRRAARGGADIVSVRRERQNELRAVRSRRARGLQPDDRADVRMYCTTGATHVCTGGNGASVYFPDRGVVTGYETDTCGGGLVVGPNTTCGFAENVRAEYLRGGPGWINVFSPATGRTYDMYCTGSSPHVCTGGNNAAVYFP